MQAAPAIAMWFDSAVASVGGCAPYQVDPVPWQPAHVSVDTAA